ncbi:Bcr/CflA family drug resistance efflux transporter [Sphingobium jiangsuense]|uniref:MFS transporter n=1 Tax=Sphingobium jiangsuense TaxID=870476 RepID=UPI00235B749F|nr:MFS transporter [Sphingobium jiangsuense]GLS99189.1 Bcr/CflA family drug resistance efflux transporter [Sphingobium jiangsuense]
MREGKSDDGRGEMTARSCRPRGQATILILAAIAAMGSMAIHMLVPALPLMASEFAIGPTQAQWTISIYLWGLAGGQLLAGPLADRYGRRPVMLAGLAGYALAGLLGAAAHALPMLVAARMMQAVGGAAGVVAARVMVGDLFPRGEAAGKQATLMAIVMISLALALLADGALPAWIGWRAVLALLGLCGAIAFAAAWRRLPETARKRRSISAGGASGEERSPSLLRSYRRLFANRQFLLIDRFGLSPAEAGGCLLGIAVASIVGTRFVAPIERRGDALVTGTAFCAGGALVALALALLGIEGPVPFIAPILLLGVGAGLAGPAAINNVIFAEEGLAATAASLAGAVQMLASGAGMMALGAFSPIDPLRLAIGLALATGLAFLGALKR